MSHTTMNLNLKVWRQKNTKTPGAFEMYRVENISDEMSFLEMMDILNEQLITEGGEPVAFDHDCREGICGMCSMYINGKPHGPWQANTTCQLHMRSFNDGDTIVVEPWRASPFPVIKDLVVDRSAFDRIISAGGFISVNTGNAQDANAIPIPKENVRFVDISLAFLMGTVLGGGMSYYVGASSDRKDNKEKEPNDTND